MTAAPLSPQDWETLTAYLDDELSPRERGDLEQRLEREPALQREFKMLQQTWDALALLEPAHSNDALTTTTLQYVIQESAPVPAEVPKSPRSYFWFGLLAGTVLLALSWLVSVRRPARVETYSPPLPQAAESESREYPLTRVDERRLLLWLDRFLAKHQDELVPSLPERVQRQLKTATPQATRLILRRVFRRQADRLALPIDEVDQLREHLSPAAQSQFNQAESVDSRCALVREWILTVLNQRRPGDRSQVD